MDRLLKEQVLKTIRSYEMLGPGTKVIVALSGGPDSVFLFYALMALKSKLKIKDIAVCHIDHGLRGRESRADSAFTKELCAKFGVKFFEKKVNLKKAKSDGLSTEERAREMRYRFYKEIAEKLGARVVATGHTLDDQAETVLMRIIKGSALKGIVGIPPAREEGKVKFIRPLIALEKRAIREWLDSEKLSYRIDATNLENIYFRNTVRNEIIPYLEKYNPRLKRVLFNLAEHLREDFEFIENEKLKIKGIIGRQRRGRFEIELKKIAVQPKALQKEILRDALERSGGAVKRLSYRHWKDMERFIKYNRRGSSLDLPGGVRVSRTDSSLIFEHRPS